MMPWISFLSRLNVPGPPASADALWVCALAVSAASLVGASAGLVRRPR